MNIKTTKNKVAMMQPTFLPWQGYFELIYKADTFIFLDDFQYVNRSFHSRNKLFISQGKVDYTIIPLRRTEHYPNINQIQILNNEYWRSKFLKKLEIYKKTPYYDPIIQELKTICCDKFSSLADFNITIIKFLCRLLNINTNFIYSSQFFLTSSRSQRIYDLLTATNATCYLCANGSFEYMLEDKIFPCELPVYFQNFYPKPYKQIHSKEFIPYLSILDALFNIGPQETYQLIINGTPKWLTWKERFHQYKEDNNE